MAKPPDDKVEDAEILVDEDDHLLPGGGDRVRPGDRSLENRTETISRDRKTRDRGKRSRLTRRFDGFVATFFKLLAFGIISGAILGVVAAIVMTQLAGPETSEQAATLAELQMETERLATLHQELRNAVEENALSLESLSAEETGVNPAAIDARLSALAGALETLQGNLGSVADEVGKHREQIAQVLETTDRANEAYLLEELNRIEAELSRTLQELAAHENNIPLHDGARTAPAARLDPSGPELAIGDETEEPTVTGEASVALRTVDRIDELAKQINVVRDAAEASAAGNLQQIDQVQASIQSVSASIEEVQDNLRSITLQIDALARNNEGIPSGARIVALLTLRSAVEQGRPFSHVLEAGALEASEIPGPLADHADTGVVSLRQLQDEFEEYASAAFWVPEETGDEDGMSTRARRFLSSLIQVRSLQPQEGDNIAAILSRATAAIREGDIEEALTELQALPDQTLRALDAWTGQARDRLAALDAVDALVDDWIRQMDRQIQ